VISKFGRIANWQDHMIDFDGQIPREIDRASGLPVGPLVTGPTPARPARIVLEGRFCRLEPLDPARHGDGLFTASTPGDADARFLYLSEEPPASRTALEPWLEEKAASLDPLYFAVVDKRTGRVEGRQTFLRIDPAARSIEIGHIYWGPAIARSAVTTEANYLFAAYAFDQLGYQRYEWKCNALNAPSRASALRFGFTFEGHFRRAVVTKGRVRDTTWYSMIGEEWPAIKAGYQAWLDASNFDAAGQQRRTLAACLTAARGV
jgi:RimJ/RimL family protein N-acetyltransferase